MLESDSLIGNENILTPYKDFLVGGNMIGEDMDNLHIIQSTKNHYIYICEIESIYVSFSYLVIVKKNQEIEKLSFFSEDDKNEILSSIRKNYKESYRMGTLDYIILKSDKISEISDQIEFLKIPSKVCYT